MSWTQYLEHPEEVTGLFREDPSLAGFLLEQVVLENGRILLEGELADKPDPLPDRWSARGYTRVRVRLELRKVQTVRIEGVPQLHILPNAQLRGESVDLEIGADPETGSETSEAKTLRRVITRNGPCQMEVTCESIGIELSGI